MRRVILHIGLHKTGTSALQQFLCDNRNALADAGWHYDAPWGKWPNQNPLVAAFETGTGNLPAGQQGVATMLHRAGERSVLVSSETLARHNIDIDAFLACFQDCDLRAIVYLRHPADLLISAYNQIVKAAGSTATRAIDEPPLAYAANPVPRLSRWFDRIPVVVAPFDPPQWDGGRLSSDFLAMLGIDPTPFTEPERHENESVSHLVIEVLRGVNSLNLPNDARASLLRHLNGIAWPKGSYPLSPETIAAVIAEMRMGLADLRPHFRPGFDETFLTAPRPKAD